MTDVPALVPCCSAAIEDAHDSMTGQQRLNMEAIE